MDNPKTQGNIGHMTQNEDTQKIHNTEKMSNTDPSKKKQKKNRGG
jgi:hypothetical protein